MTAREEVEAALKKATYELDMSISYSPVSNGDDLGPEAQPILRALIELGVRLGLAEAWGRAMKRVKFGKSSAEGTAMILEGAEFREFAIELDALIPAGVLEGWK